MTAVYHVSTTGKRRRQLVKSKLFIKTAATAGIGSQDMMAELKYTNHMPDAFC